MTDQERSDIYVVFTTILCDLLCLISYEANINKLASDRLSEPCILSFKAIWCKIANLLTFVLIEVL